MKKHELPLPCPSCGWTVLTYTWDAYDDLVPRCGKCGYQVCSTYVNDHTYRHPELLREAMTTHWNKEVRERGKK